MNYEQNEAAQKKKGIIMLRRLFVTVSALFFVLAVAYSFATESREVFGVRFPGEKVVNGKTLKINGAAGYKVMRFIKIYARAFYLERPTRDAREAIESEQIKQSYIHYVTDMAKVKRIQESFIKDMEKANPPELVKKHRADIEKHASWLDKDGAPGKLAITTYLPGKGLIVYYFGEIKGIFPDKEYAQMYFRSFLGEKADKKRRKDYLGQ
jgi:hypothetical protein